MSEINQSGGARKSRNRGGGGGGGEGGEGESPEYEENFFQYVFKFDERTKDELMNITQYAILAVVPIVILNKLVQKYIPEADETKGSLEITVEILLQILCMFFGIFFINRIIYYVPTYSGRDYPENFQVLQIIIVTLLIILSLQTKIGEKVSILYDRCAAMWDGREGLSPKKPAAKKQTFTNLGGGNNVGYPPVKSGMTNMDRQSSQNASLISNLPALNENPAATTAMQESFQSMDGSSSEILAANDALGGGFGGAGYSNF